MSCAKFEERIALHVEGDLGPKEAAVVERHLGQCAACCALAEELRESQAALKTLRHQRVGEEIFAELRRSVLVNVRPRTATWKCAAAAAVLVIAAAALFLRGPQRPQVGRAILPAAGVQTARSGDVPARPPKRRLQPRLAAPHVHKPDPEPLLVKLVTNDPDVVIYWLVDHNGG